MFQNFKMFLYAKLGVNHLEGNPNPPNPLSHEEYRHSHTTFRSHVTVCRVYLSRVNEVAGSTSICGRATNSLDPWWEQSAWVHPVQPREWSQGERGVEIKRTSNTVESTQALALCIWPKYSRASTGWGWGQLKQIPHQIWRLCICLPQTWVGISNRYS